MPSPTARALRDIAISHGTDKQGVHSYAEAYEGQLGHLRSRPIVLLEIGVGGYADPNAGGASLRMWKEYFPHARVIGIDIYDKTALAEDRIVIERGDQSDAGFLAALAAKYGPFDVIVDDGSHVCAHVVASFEGLFEHLSPDGIYAIEDLQTSYWEGAYGGSSAPGAPGTTMALLRGLADGLNHAEFDIADYHPSYFDLNVRSVTFFHNLAFIQKGPNSEGSNILPPHPRRERLFSTVGPAVVRAPATARPGHGTRGWLRRTIPKPIRTRMMAGYRRLRPGR